MDSFIINGSTSLKGSIPISGSKNAALPLMAAALLSDSTVIIKNVPRLQDIYTFNNVLRVTGAKVEYFDTSNTLSIDSSNLHFPEAPYDLVRKMRASFYMLGALLGKMGTAKVSLPGGCAWGPRPVDLHLKGLQAMGAEIELDEGYVNAKAAETLYGKEFTLNPGSVGATVNLVLAAVLRANDFTIRNAAKEPDVVQLCDALIQMGANIEGAGTENIRIRKTDSLSGGELHNAPDRIETGTFLLAAAMHPDSNVILTGCNISDMGNFMQTLEQTGVSIICKDDTISIKATDSLHPVSITTGVYPGFPTDLQAQWATMLTQAKGNSTVTDTVYFDRFSYVPELVRLGANIRNEHNTVHIQGKTPLKGASVMSTDLRASVSLVMAAMIAEKETKVLRVYHLDRGYEDLEKKLNNAGASIERVKE